MRSAHDQKKGLSDANEALASVTKAVSGAHSKRRCALPFYSSPSTFSTPLHVNCIFRWQACRPYFSEVVQHLQQALGPISTGFLFAVLSAPRHQLALHQLDTRFDTLRLRHLI